MRYREPKMRYREPTEQEKQLLIEVACYFSERAVMERGQEPKERPSEVYERVARIIAEWKPEKVS